MSVKGWFANCLCGTLLIAGVSSAADEAPAAVEVIKVAAPVGATTIVLDVVAPESEENEPGQDGVLPVPDMNVGNQILVNLITAPFRLLFGGAEAQEDIIEEAVDMVLMPAFAAVEDVEVMLAADGNPVDVQDAMNQEQVQQLRPILYSELEFVRLMFPNLTVEQRKVIKGPADASLKAAKMMAERQMREQQGQPVKSKKFKEPRTMIRDQISTALQSVVDDQQFQRYAAEVARRNEKRKRTAILSLIVRLDQQLLLNQDQRDKIIASIAAKWQDGWEKWTMMSQVYGDRYFPVVPEGLIVPHLTADQKMVWQSLQQVEFSWWNNDGGNPPENDGWWDVGDEKAGKDAAEKAADEELQGLRNLGNGLLELFR